MLGGCAHDRQSHLGSVQHWSCRAFSGDPGWSEYSWCIVHQLYSDHLSLLMVLTYKPLICRTKPTNRMIKTLSTSRLQLIKVYWNQKPWVNEEARELLKIRDVAYKAQDTASYSLAKANLKHSTEVSKNNYRLRTVSTKTTQIICGKPDNIWLLKEKPSK